MKRMKRITPLIVLLLAPAIGAHSQAVTTVPNLMNFQGRLAKPDGTSIPDGIHTLTFRIYDAQTGGNVKWTERIGSIIVRNGLFAAVLGKQFPITSAILNGNVWLEIQYELDSPLIPRQPFQSVAYAFKANTVPDGSIGAAQIASGSITADKFASGAISIYSAGTGLTLTGNVFSIAIGGVTNPLIAAGSVTADKFAPGVLNPLAWLLGGNSGVTSGFLGTMDNNPLVFKVNRHQAMRYSYAENTTKPSFEYRSINVLGGSEINTIDAGIVGATISGGGLDFITNSGDGPNAVTGNFGTIGGGKYNTAGFASTVGGGSSNAASYASDTIAGGDENTANGAASAVGGGEFNTASGDFAAIAGGQSNLAAGQYSFAAGQQAQANHNGSFVWNDSTNAIFSSTGVNEFLINATGGVGINTNNPAGNALNVNGTAQMTGLKLSTGAGAGKVLISDTAGVGTWQTFTFPAASGDLTGTYPNLTIAPGVVKHGNLASDSASLSPVSGGAMTSAGGNVGIGTSTPQQRLDVNGNLSLTDTGNLAIIFNGNSEYGSDTGIGHPGDGILTLWTDAAERVRVIANGNVGIGTPSPQQSLDVNGNARISGNFGVGGQTPNYPLSFAYASGDKIAFLGEPGWHYGIGTQPYVLQFYTDGPTSDFVYGYGTSADFHETSRISGSGNISANTLTANGITDIGGASIAGDTTINGNANIGGGFELGYPENPSNTPYIDFHFGGVPNQDYNVRIINDGDQHLTVTGGTTFSGGVGVLGSIGVKTQFPNYDLDVRGNGRFTGSLTYSSDARYKTNVVTIDNALDDILNLRGVTFDWKRDDFKDMNFPEGRQVGFIAQELEKILPELVHKDSAGYRSVAYANVVPVLVEAMKQQQKQIDDLKKQNATLADYKAENDRLKARADAADATMKELLAALKQLQDNQNVAHPIGK